MSEFKSMLRSIIFKNEQSQNNSVQEFVESKYRIEQRNLVFLVKSQTTSKPGDSPYNFWSGIGWVISSLCKKELQPRTIANSCVSMKHAQWKSISSLWLVIPSITDQLELSEQWALTCEGVVDQFCNRTDKSRTWRSDDIVQAAQKKKLPNPLEKNAMKL